MPTKVSLANSSFLGFATPKAYTLQPRYNARRLSADSAITPIGRWIPLNDDGVILQSYNILLTA